MIGGYETSLEDDIVALIRKIPHSEGKLRGELEKELKEKQASLIELHDKAVAKEYWNQRRAEAISVKELMDRLKSYQPSQKVFIVYEDYSKIPLLDLVVDDGDVYLKG